MKLQIEVIIGLIVAVVLAVVLSIFAGHYMKLRDTAAQGVIDERKLETTSSVIADSDEAATERQRVDTGVTEARGTFQNQVAEAKRNEPDTASRATRPVPASVRNAYRERRLARERLGRSEVGDESRAGSQDAPER